jgi:hypothetical protein
MKNLRHEVDRLSSIVRPWRNRLALKGALKWATLGSAGGLGFAIILLSVARLVPWPAVLLWGVIATVAGTMCGVVYSFTIRPSLEATARQTDHLMGLADRLGTAWEFRSSNSTLATLQRQDALASAGALVPGESIIIWPSLRHFIPVMVGLVLFGLLVVLPNPMDRVIQERERLREQLAQVGEELRRTEKELSKPEASLSAEDRAAAEDVLKKLQEALRDARDIPSALAAVSEAEQEISQLQEPKIDQSSASGSWSDPGFVTYHSGYGEGTPVRGRADSIRLGRRSSGPAGIYERSRTSRVGSDPTAGGQRCDRSRIPLRLSEAGFTSNRLR